MNILSLPNFDIKKNIGYIVIGLAMVLIFFTDAFLVVRPQLKTMSSLGQRGAEISKDIKETRYYIQNIGSLEAEAGQLKAKLDVVSGELLAHQEAEMILETISKTAEKYSIIITQAVPSKEQEIKPAGADAGEFVGLPLIISGEGEYHNIGFFLNALENDDILLDVQEFSIKENPKSVKKHILEMTVISFLPKKILE